MEEFCHKLPKVELHAHINGSISESTMAAVIKLRSDSVDSDWRLMFKKGESGSLEDTFKMFRLIHQVSNSEAAAYKITYDVVHEFAAENVKYIELRTTPREENATGMTRESYVQTVLRAIEDCRSEDLDIIVRLLLAIDRRGTLETAFDTVDLAVKYREKSNGTIVGIDLSGNPYIYGKRAFIAFGTALMEGLIISMVVGDATKFIPALRKAKDNDLKLALHLAEIPAPEETSELLCLVPDRIGHGTCLQPETGGTQGLVDTVSKHRIPLELCLTSNIVNEVVPGYDSHHFKFWYEQNHPCIICTDDKGVFSTTLTEEYCKAAETFDLNKQQLWDLSYRGIDYTFVDSDVKQTLRDKWKSCTYLLNK